MGSLAANGFIYIYHLGTSQQLASKRTIPLELELYLQRTWIVCPDLHQRLQIRTRQQVVEDVPVRHRLLPAVTLFPTTLLITEPTLLPMSSRQLPSIVDQYGGPEASRVNTLA